MASKKCKLLPDGKYNAAWCLEVKCAAEQCQDCGNNPKNKVEKK